MSQYRKFLLDWDGQQHRAPVALAERPDADVQHRARALLARLPTMTEEGQPPSVRTQAIFGSAPTGLTLPLNRKTTMQAIAPLPLLHLEPRQEYVAVPGLTAYIARPRNDPPDVARVQMRDGRIRLLVQEGHTRLGAAVLRGDDEMPVRVWEFVQTETGAIVPVSRGRHQIGERQRDRLIHANFDDPDPDVDVDPDLDPDEDDYDDDEDDDDYESDDGEEPEEDEEDLELRAFQLPNVADVNFPTLIGAIPSKPPRKRRKRVQYHGVSLSRRPLKFEAQVLSLAEIPPRLDAAVQALQQPESSLYVTLSAVAQFGAQQALLELVRQGAPDTILGDLPDTDDAVRDLSVTIEAARATDLSSVLQDYTAKLRQRRLPRARREALVRELSDRRAPGIVKRHASHGVNMAFALGRAAVIERYRRPHGLFDLASKQDKLVSGSLWVDAVFQTAVMDTNTCEECEDVDGEQMELGSDRQEELHPPYVKCLGGDRCRCIQIALLSDGSEIEVDELPDEAYDTEAF